MEYFEKAATEAQEELSELRRRYEGLEARLAHRPPVSPKSSMHGTQPAASAAAAAAAAAGDSERKIRGLEETIGHLRAQVAKSQEEQQQYRYCRLFKSYIYHALFTIISCIVPSCS